MHATSANRRATRRRGTSCRILHESMSPAEAPRCEQGDSALSVLLRDSLRSLGHCLPVHGFPMHIGIPNGISMKHPCRNFGASLSGLGLFCGLAHASASLHRYYSVHETFYQSSLVDKATRLISSLIGSIRFFWPGFFGQSRSYRLASALYSSSPTKRTLIVRPPKKRPFRSAIARCAASTLLSSM